jgi:PleD family two-component response regulator
MTGAGPAARVLLVCGDAARRAAEAARGDARPRILVVEDEPEVGEILDAFFSAEGRFEVVLARTGADAIDKARDRPPDVSSGCSSGKPKAGESC